jgi:hypothetical protein
VFGLDEFLADVAGQFGRFARLSLKLHRTRLAVQRPSPVATRAAELPANALRYTQAGRACAGVSDTAVR